MEEIDVWNLFLGIGNFVMIFLNMYFTNKLTKRDQKFQNLNQKIQLEKETQIKIDVLSHLDFRTNIKLTNTGENSITNLDVEINYTSDIKNLPQKLGIFRFNRKMTFQPKQSIIIENVEDPFESILKQNNIISVTDVSAGSRTNEIGEEEELTFPVHQIAQPFTILLKIKIKYNIVEVPFEMEKWFNVKFSLDESGDPFNNQYIDNFTVD